MSDMFKRIVFSAVQAGTVAALFLSMLQIFWVTPLILQAETYEVAAEAVLHEHTADHAHDDTVWQPEDGWQRTLSTATSNIVIAIGFALMLSGIYTLRNPSGIWQGLAWGLAGYAVFFVAPALGLPPDLPGTTAAELIVRQYWWLGTALATAGGLGLVFLQSNWLLRMTGALLLLIPHLLGAPQLEMTESLAPVLLQNQFRWASALSNAVFWMVLGVSSALIFNRLQDRSE
ncbi:MAG TPA: CbtA family protein [Methylobacter sp.]|jgi:cobalt transporter subunit CbtA